MKQLFIVAFFLLSTFTFVLAAASAPFIPERLVAVGDIHGDLDQAKAILSLSNVIDSEGKWIGGSHTKLVQMGDLVDRGEQDKEVLDFFLKLQQEAKEAGSEIVMMLGNHEVMNMMGDVRYVHPKAMKTFGGKDAHKKAWSKDGEYGSWIRDSFKLVHIYNGTLFCHAGLAASYANYGEEKLNIAARNALQKNDFNNPIFGGDGPVWTRLLINKAEYGKCDMVEATLKKLNVERMIVGHTPQRDLRVKAYCDAKLIAIDVGISKNMYGGLAALEISQDPTTGETVLEEIVPNDADERSNNELNKLEEQGGMDADLLQEMMQAVNEMERENKKKNKKDGGENKPQKEMTATERATLAAQMAKAYKAKKKAKQDAEAEL